MNFWPSRDSIHISVLFNFEPLPEKGGSFATLFDICRLIYVRPIRDFGEVVL